LVQLGTTAPPEVALQALADRLADWLVQLGELNNMNGEGVSRSDITLGLPQVELLKALKATGKPVILILTAGRPLALTETEPLADAIIAITRIIISTYATSNNGHAGPISTLIILL
jgi:hypothetical protein